MPADASTVIVEGVGVFRRALADLFDVVVWMQSDFGEARRRGVRRDIADLGRDESDAQRHWEEWEAEEVPFLLADRPWARACFIVGTASTVPHDAESEVVVAPPLGATDPHTSK